MTDYLYYSSKGILESNYTIDAFPLPLEMTDLRFATVANGGKIENTANGGITGNLTVPADFEVRLGSPTGAKTPHEIERYDPVTGNIVLHLMPGDFPDAQTIYFCYGNPDVVTSQEDIADLWSHNGYLAVYHFGETSGNTYYDSSGNGNHLDATTVSATGRDGAFGYGIELDGVDDYLSIGNLFDTDDEFIAEFYYKSTHRPSGSDFMVPMSSGSAYGAGNWEFRFYFGDSEDEIAISFRLHTTRAKHYDCPQFYDGNWRYVGGTTIWSSGQGGYYWQQDSVNQISCCDSSASAGISNDHSKCNEVYIGKRYASDGCFYKGYIDEVRIKTQVSGLEQGHTQAGFTDSMFTCSGYYWGPLSSEVETSGTLYVSGCTFE
jgi:hypothetical protein